MQIDKKNFVYSCGDTSSIGRQISTENPSNRFGEIKFAEEEEIICFSAGLNHSLISTKK